LPCAAVLLSRVELGTLYSLSARTIGLIYL
jgi:hypothetical protein